MKTKLFSKNKVQIISDNNKKSVKIKKIISQKILKNFKHKFNITIVIGGDGFMLSTLKKYNKFGIPFNAFYSSKFPEGIVMNEILTEKQIFETYNKVK